MALKSQLESLLFVALKPLSVRDLAAAVSAKVKEAEEALAELEADYRASGRGLAIIKNDGRYQLATAAENAALIREFLKDETSGELSQPSLETLTIIAYRGPIAKLELEKIRGVNCSLILRNLLLRGLVEEKSFKDKEDSYYTVTPEFIRFLGLSSPEDLPDYGKLNQSGVVSEVLSGTEEVAKLNQ